MQNDPNNHDPNNQNTETQETEDEKPVPFFAFRDMDELLRRIERGDY